MWKLIWIFFVLSSINWAWWLGKLSSSLPPSLSTLFFSVCRAWCVRRVGWDGTLLAVNTKRPNKMLYSLFTLPICWNGIFFILLWNPFLHFLSLLCMCSYCEWHNIYISMRTWRWTCILMWGLYHNKIYAYNIQREYFLYFLSLSLFPTTSWLHFTGNKLWILYLVMLMYHLSFLSFSPTTKPSLPVCVCPFFIIFVGGNVI